MNTVNATWSILYVSSAESKHVLKAVREVDNMHLSMIKTSQLSWPLLSENRKTKKAKSWGGKECDRRREKEEARS